MPLTHLIYIRGYTVVKLLRRAFHNVSEQFSPSGSPTRHILHQVFHNNLLVGWNCLNPLIIVDEILLEIQPDFTPPPEYPVLRVFNNRIVSTRWERCWVLVKVLDIDQLEFFYGILCPTVITDLISGGGGGGGGDIIPFVPQNISNKVLNFHHFQRYFQKTFDSLRSPSCFLLFCFIL